MNDRIKGITIEIDGDTSKLSKALKDVNSKIKQSQNNLKDIDKLLKFDPGNTQLLQQKYQNLGTEIDETKKKLENLKIAESQASQALVNGSIGQQEFDSLQREIIETEQTLKSLEKEFKNFGSVAAQQVAAVGEKMKDAGGKIAGVGSSLTKHVTLPIAAVGTVGAASFAEVDKTMQLANKTMGNSATEAEELNKAMKEAAANSTFGMSDAANATLNFARAGLNAKQSAAALAPAMNLAAGEGGDLDTVSAGLVATINGFHGAFEDTEKYADVFAAACNNSALDVNSLSNAMSVAAPIFSSAGYSVKDAALYMGVMANNGIEASVAANSLKTGFARLVSPAEEGAKMMDKLGISVNNADGSMKNSVLIQKELHDAFAALSESEQIAAASAIFGKNQMTPWLALINTAPGDVDKLNNAIAKCDGTTQEMADTMMGGFGGSVEKAKSSLDVLVYSLGESLVPVISKVIGFVQGLVDWFNALSPEQRDLIVNIGLIVAAIGPLLLFLGKLMTAVGSIMTWAPKIVSALSGITKVVGVLGSGLKVLWGIIVANPIALIISAIAALVAAFVYLWNHCEEFRQFWIDLWEGIKAVVTDFVEVVKQLWQKFISALAKIWETIKNVVASACEAIMNSVTTAWNAIKTTVSNAVNGVKDKIYNGFTAARDTISNILNSIRDKFKAIWDGVTSIVSGAINKIKSFFNFHWELPKIKLPHFSIQGNFSLSPPSIPHISVDWYKKAMNDGMILNSPTIFGMGRDGRLLGGGEAGSETVVGTDSLRSMITGAVAAAVSGVAAGDIIIPVYFGQERIDEIVVTATQRTNYRSGGR